MASPRHVGLDKPMSLRPSKRCANRLAELARLFRSRRPQRLKRAQDIFATDPVDLLVTEVREGVLFHRLPPFLSDFLATPARPVRFIGPLGGLLERRHPSLALFGEWIAPVSDGDAVGEGPLARFCERDNRKRPETEIAALAVNRDSLDPRLRSARRDGQIERRIGPVHPRFRERFRRCRGELSHIFPTSQPTFDWGTYRNRTE